MEPGERGWEPGAVSPGTRKVNHEALSIEVAHQVTVDRRVRAEAILGVQEQDVDLLAHVSHVRGESVVRSSKAARL